MILKTDYKECLDYISKYWNKITFYAAKDNGVHVGLPNKFICPNTTRYNKDQFYWDSYFVILGLINSEGYRGEGYRGETSVFTA
ncbi:hypothetical protein KJ973_02600 [Patescibacteria group bacterium]|nr:hypothetical protein [Patescibacteria group bacterium]MBU1246436.1 hypothetical protein [Patescibacteria group bacterium]MBU1519554.1 hypothetical protein [Patescibacteria group bacterium]MBU1730588.1 hypothetical protein [Patescibacteria group bacterium]MBU1956056.1 hypothetical protein [Patescibacteria group bacterium]